MDHVTAEENNLVERYLLGRLAAEEATRFEEHYLDCPECLEKLELSRRLRQGLKDVVAEDGASLARTAVLAWLSRRGRWAPAALAVALLAVAVLPWALLGPRVSRLEGELAGALAPRAGTPVYALSPERSGPGEEPSTRVTLGAAPEWVTLALYPPPSTSPVRYRVRLREAEGQLLWRSGPLDDDGSGKVTVSVHSSWLEEAGYVAELDVLAPGEDSRSVTRFPFGVKRQN